MHEECSGLASCLRPRSKERIISEAFASKTDVFIAVLMLFDTPFFHFHFSFFISSVPDSHTRGDGAAGICSGRRRRSRPYAAVNSTPYSRITDEM